MGEIFLGALAFAAAFAFDWVSWLGLARPKPVLGLAAVALMGAALVRIAASPSRFRWPAWTAYAGWPLLLAAGVLAIYSLFIEIPFTATYARPGVGPTLVKTGTYALVRHPGVLWFGFWMLGFVLVTRQRLAPLAGAIWLVLDVILVWLEEVLLFGKMFPGYAAYQRETPMLVPTPRSLVACLRTWPRRPSGLPKQVG